MLFRSGAAWAKVKIVVILRHHFRQRGILMDGQEGMSQENNEYSKVTSLSVQETKVLKLMANGCTTPEIAKKLFIAESTVRDRRRSIYRKLGATGQRHLGALAVTIASRMGLLSESGESMQSIIIPLYSSEHTHFSTSMASNLKGSTTVFVDGDGTFHKATIIDAEFINIELIHLTLEIPNEAVLPQPKSMGTRL